MVQDPRCFSNHEPYGHGYSMSHDFRTSFFSQFPKKNNLWPLYSRFRWFVDESSPANPLRWFRVSHIQGAKQKDRITRSAAIAALDEQLWITDQRRGVFWCRDHGLWVFWSESAKEKVKHVKIKCFCNHSFIISCFLALKMLFPKEVLFLKGSSPFKMNASHGFFWYLRTLAMQLSGHCLNHFVSRSLKFAWFFCFSLLFPPTFVLIICDFPNFLNNKMMKLSQSTVQACLWCSGLVVCRLGQRIDELTQTRRGSAWPKMERDTCFDSWEIACVFWCSQSHRGLTHFKCI